MKIDEAPLCEIQPSAIHGRGLFALKDISKGGIVCDYSVSFERWEVCAANEIYEPYDGTLWYVGDPKRPAVRLGAFDSKFMHANHSIQPNTLWRPSHKTLTANSSIKAGDEITYDYRLDVLPQWLKKKRPEWATKETTCR